MATHICYSLETASKKGHQDCIVRLLNYHDSIHTLFSDDYRLSVLHNTIRGDYDDCFILLLDRFQGNALINKQDDMGRTLLHYAVLFKNNNIIMALLDRPEGGADVDIKDDEGFTPIDFADEQTKDFITGYLHWDVKEPYQN